VRLSSSTRSSQGMIWFQLAKVSVANHRSDPSFRADRLGSRARVRAPDSTADSHPKPLGLARYLVGIPPRGVTSR